MPLSCDQAIRLGLVQDPTNKFEGKRDASYDLHAQYVIWNGREYDLTNPTDRQAQIPPQGTFTIVSREILRIDGGYVAFAFLKTAVAREGILAINTGIIDAGWHNHLATTAINFSSRPIPVGSLSAFLRIVFDPVVGGKRSAPSTFDHTCADQYLKEQVARSVRFPTSFLNVPEEQARIIASAKQEMMTESFKAVARVVGFVSILALLLAGVFPLVGALVQNAIDRRSSVEAANDTRVEGLESRMRDLERDLLEAKSRTPAEPTKRPVSRVPGDGNSGN